MASVVSTVVIGGDGAGTLVLGEDSGGDADVDATVEEIICDSAEARRPANRDGYVTNGRAAALGDDGIDDLVGLGDRVGAVVGVERGEVADEVLVAEAHLHGDGLDEVVVVVDAVGEDQDDENVHRGTAGVTSEMRMGPK
jgi:hypothetical protein